MDIRISLRLAAFLTPIALHLACSGSTNTAPEPTPKTLSMEKIGEFAGGALGAAEITAYDAGSKRLFVVNGANGTVDVLDLSTPSAPKKAATPPRPNFLDHQEGVMDGTNL